MKLSIHDPILTSYALGELDETERAKVETALEQSPECRAAVEEIRQTARFLTDEFSREPGAALTEPQREAVVSEAPTITVEEQKIVELPARRWGDWRIAALAACLVISLGGLLWILPSYGKATQRVAKIDAPRHNTTTPKVNPTQGKPQFVQVSGDGDGVALAAKPATEPQMVPAPVPVSSGTVQDQTPVGKKIEAVDGLSDRYAVRRSAPTPVVTGFVSTPVSPQVQPPPGGETVDAVFEERYGKGTSLQTRAAAESENRLSQQSIRPQVALKSGSQPSPKVIQGGSSELASASSRGRPASPASERSYLRLAETQQRLGRGVELRSKDRWYVERGTEQLSSASYPQYIENSFLPVIEQPLSTLSIDVDTASYANVRRFLRQGQLPPRDAVRIEELINYFSYNYPAPRGDEPFAANIEVATSPWNPRNRLVRIGLKGCEIARDKRPPSNFVFLIDVSGSMSPAERLPLIKQSLRLLVKRMNESDRVAIVF